MKTSPSNIKYKIKMSKKTSNSRISNLKKITYKFEISSASLTDHSYKARNQTKLHMTIIVQHNF